MVYQPQIDGLRAFAVLSVILFHANFPIFKGGFIGVDVFFVISGYLITTIIIKEINNKTFSFIGFYERRARRILPVLFFILLISTIMAWLILLPRDMREFSQSLAATSSFLSNVFFWLKSGYFDTSTELKPLLHTWSLSVEEQYYIFFPILLVLIFKYNKNKLVMIVTSCLLLSLIFSQWSITNDKNAAFYLIFSRSWELLIGSLLSIFYIRIDTYVSCYNKYIVQIMGIASFSLLVFSILFFDKKTPFPGLYALFPTFSTVGVIIFSKKKTILYNILSYPLIVSMGLISYSAYLWHQPILAYARYISIDELSSVLKFLLIFLTFLLSYFSWKYIENPFRKRNNTFIFIYASVVISLLFIAFGIYGHIANGFDNRVAPSYLYKNFYKDIASPKNTVGLHGKRCVSEKASICQVSDGEGKRILFFGDSHSADFSSEIKKYGLLNNLNVWQMSMGGCGFILDHQHGECGKAIDKLVNIIEKKDYAEIVFIASTYSHLDNIPSSEQIINLLFLKDIFISAVNNNIDVTYFIPRPSFSIDPVKAMLFDKEELITIEKKSSRKNTKLYMEDNFKNIGISVFDQEQVLLDAFCNPNGECKNGFHNDRLLYRDKNHLSKYGKKYVFDIFTSLLRHKALNN